MRCHTYSPRSSIYSFSFSNAIREGKRTQHKEKNEPIKPTLIRSPTKRSKYIPSLTLPPLDNPIPNNGKPWIIGQKVDAPPPPPPSYSKPFSPQSPGLYHLDPPPPPPKLDKIHDAAIFLETHTLIGTDLWLKADQILTKAQAFNVHKKKKKKNTACTPVCRLNAEMISVQKNEIMLLHKTLWAIKTSYPKPNKKKINLRIKRRSHAKLQNYNI